MSPAYFAPPDDPGLPPRAAHLPPDAFLAGSDQPIEVTVSDDDADAALWYLADRGWQRTALRDDGPYRRAGTLPVAALTGKVARYAVTFGGRTFPEDRPGTPEQLGQPAAPITVFDAAQLRPEGLPAPHGTASQLTLAEGALRFTCDGFPTTGSDAAGVRLGARPATCEQPVVLVRARATEESTTSFELGLVLEDGRAYGYDVPIGLEWATVRVPADQLRPLWSTKGGRFESDRLREVSLVFGTWLYGAASAQAHGFELASVSVEPGLPGWAVPVEPIGPPVPLLRPAAAARLRLNTGGARSRLIGVPGEVARGRVLSPGFGPRGLVRHRMVRGRAMRPRWRRWPVARSCGWSRAVARRHDQDEVVLVESELGLVPSSTFRRPGDNRVALRDSASFGIGARLPAGARREITAARGRSRACISPSVRG